MPTPKKSDHKNAARSRHLIKKAFAELLNEKNINKITVTDVVERAGISRGTFYAHYLDIFDLYSAIQTNIIETVDVAIEKYDPQKIIHDPRPIISASLNFLEQNKNYYRLFITSSHSDSLVNRVCKRIEERLSAMIPEKFDKEYQSEIHCYLLYTLGALKNVLLYWLNDDLRLTPEQCTEYIAEFYIKNRPDSLVKAFSDNETSE